ncbi:MAG: hypothetical protein JNM40_23120 [Myxococcales bacterium]|nr:hypothetical protein [Myxococcales bacterium]
MAVRSRAGAGRTTAYKTLPCLQLPSELPIPMCTRCHSQFVPTSRRTKVRLHGLYIEELQRRTRLAISALGNVRSLRKIEQLIGASQGYLSKLRAGTSNPSPELTLLLGLLASSPKQMLQRADAFWAQPTDDGLNLATRSAS